ncbi:MAG: glycoside hydrolase family 2 [Promicromonosporaceae bacterium]|nr:glycoside hydrolase family 2 [Promicromonosporaceae bacterium]
MRQLFTVWGENLDTENVLPEYPRPTLVRDSYLNLNGWWDYTISVDPDWPQTYDGQILVPFSPEAALSGVSRILQPHEFLFYRRDFQIPNGFNRGRIILHFGAVDQTAEVWVNDNLVGTNVGGYLPFNCDITEFVTEGSNSLRVKVTDVTDTSYFSRGKQKLKRGGMFYTPQSGIWQTVWLESVPDQYLTDVELTPDFDSNTLEVLLSAVGDDPAALVAFDLGENSFSAVLPVNATVRIALPELESWTPGNPKLHDVTISYGPDTVTSYFAMRKISLGRDSLGIPRFFLNNQPYFHNGLLDQGYWPDGLMTAPSDEALIFDIQEMKRLGFNTLRKHIKIEPARWYYHCDRLGMLVWQDFVNGGGKIHSWFVTYLPSIITYLARHIRDNKYRLFSREDQTGKDMFYWEAKETVDALKPHPSIVLWGPFNEGWGQFDARKITAFLRAWDPTRLIDEASGWYDQWGGDVYSIHNYFRKLKIKPKPPRAVAVTEYGGYAYRDPDHSAAEKIYGYRKYSSPEALTAAYAKLFRRDIIGNVPNGLSGAIYTQVSDIEDEVNGIYTYDRKVLKLDPDTLITLNAELRREFQLR